MLERCKGFFIFCCQRLKVCLVAERKLSELISNANNNTDLIRLILACMVIYGHAYTISPEAGRSDFLKINIGIASSSLAVYIFFFLSGLLVSNSLVNRGSIQSYIISRMFRIWPALIFLITITAFVMGPLLTTVTLQEYFTAKYIDGISYFVRNIQLKSQYYLPGVFGEVPYKGVVNGSLWTLIWEVKAYIALLVVFYLGMLERRLILAAFIFLILNFVSKDPIIFEGRGPLLFLSFSFMVGVVFTLWKDQVKIGFKQLLLLVLFAYYSEFLLSQLFMYFAIFYGVLWVSGLKWFVKLKPSMDISYGVYLWGFPVAQVLVLYFPEGSIFFHQFVSIFVTIIIGFISCKFIEKPFVRLGGKLDGKLKDWFASVSLPKLTRL